GINKEVSEFLHLKNQPAVQVGAVIPGFTADKAGLKAGDIILKLDGQPLERGDEPEEAAMILLHKVRRMKPGATITFSILKPNEIVTQINRTPVTDIDQFKQLYQDFRKTNKKEAVVLEVLRGVNTEVIRIEPPQ